MGNILRRIADPFMNVMMEHIIAELAQQQAKADYIAMMADVEIPTEEEGDGNVV